MTSITTHEIKEILLLCTKNVHFTFRDIATDRVATLWPVLVELFLVDLERSLGPILTAKFSIWKQYVDDTITFVKTVTVDHSLSMLNNFDSNIQFKYETEYSFKSASLDFMLGRYWKNFVATVYHKVTNVDVYLHWSSFFLHSWKRRTSKTLTKCIYKFLGHWT